jgi:uncharacterized protein YndB with AHSA1/START domain
MSPAIIHKSFVIDRTFKASVERVFHALANPEKKRRWFAESTGFHIDSYTLDFQVGGFERTRFRFGDGPPMTNDCVYMDIVKNERVVFAYSMTLAGAPMSSSLGSMELSSTPDGTRLRFTEHTAFVDGNDGSAARREGTEGLFDRLVQELATHD